MRKRIQEMLDKKCIVTLIHPDAVIAEDVKIGIGTMVMAGAVINLGTRIGQGCIINTCSSRITIVLLVILYIYLLVLI